MISEPDKVLNNDTGNTNCEEGILGSSSGLQKNNVEFPDYVGAFRQTYLREFGFDLTHREIIVDDLRVRAVAKSHELQKYPLVEKDETPGAVGQTKCYFMSESSGCGAWQETPIYHLENFGAGQQLQGPVIVMQNTSTILVEPGCSAVITEYGDVVLSVETRTFREIGTQADPVQVSIFGNLFMSIAEQMGRTLQRTAISTNIKERHDFSCAIFDETGGLVANAPHQPVHLGAMSEAVRQQVKLQGETLKVGDVLLTNHPIAGGSHLPDITVVTPVWQNGEAIFYIASRGHHADIL